MIRPMDGSSVSRASRPLAYTGHVNRVCPGRASGALLFALLAGLWTVPAFARAAASQTSAQPSAQTPAQNSASDGSAQAGKQAQGAKKQSSTGNQSVPDAPGTSAAPATANDSGAPGAPAISNPAAPETTASDQQAKPHSAAQDNPFPEDVSREAAKSAASSSPSSGVSSSSSNSPDVDRDNGDRDPDVGRHKLPKPSDNVDAGSLSATARAKKDVQIGNFYLGTGDDKGAYARFADAGKMDPTNVDAIFGLAESARRLQRTQEAIANYQLFLDIEPDGSRAKAARKALSGLGEKK